MNIVRAILLLIITIKLYPFNDDTNRQMADFIHNLPGPLSTLLWDALSTPTWLYLIILLLLSASQILKLIRKRSLKGEQISKIRSIEDIANLSWEQFEHFTAELYQNLGFKAEVIGGTGGDDGIDVLASRGRKKVIIQCKHWKDNLGVSKVREMFGVMHAEKASEVHIIALTGFTPAAIDFADKQKRIKLIGPEDIMALLKQGRDYYKLM